MSFKKPFHFIGGVHPADNKQATAALPTRTLPMPHKLFVSMAQHLGAPAKPIVAAGDSVTTGQLIAEAGGFISAPIHAPACGKVVLIEDLVTVTGRMAPTIIIETDGRTDELLLPKLDPATAAPDALLARVAEAGIVGMGGAGFPTKVKLSPPKDKPIDTLIINGAECEPYLTADHRTMLENPDEMLQGVEIIRKILGVKCVRIAIEDNKPDAIAMLEKKLSFIQGDVAMVVLETRYPHGGEKQQIYAVTKREVPRGGLPMDIGCVVENVGTACAIYDAVVNGRPLISRRITVAGDAVTEPANLLAPIGTTYHDLLIACGGAKTGLAKLIAGGPMMGFAVPNPTVAMTKTASGLLAVTESNIYRSEACIACGRCLDACPLRLSPAEMSQCVEADDIDGAADLKVTDCCDCGCCAYVCPARRPLVQHFRRAKVIIAERAAAQKK